MGHFESLGFGAWEWDLTRDEITLNPQARGVLGRAFDDDTPVTPALWRQSVHPDDLHIWDHQYGDRAAVPRRSAVDYRIRALGDGTESVEYCVEDRVGVTERDANGRPTKLIGVWMCTKERMPPDFGTDHAKPPEPRPNCKAAEGVCRLDRRNFPSSFSDLEAVSDSWLWNQDADLRYIRHSRGENSTSHRASGQAMLGRTNQEWLDENPQIRDSADWQIVFDAQAEKKGFTNFVFSIPSYDDDSVRWCRISGTPVFDTSGVFTGYKGVGADITELYIALARAEDANRAKSAFLANMSHEIRTPLHGVLGMAEILESTLETQAHRGMIGIIRRSGETLLAILNDILDMSKIESGNFGMEIIAFSPAEVAQRVHALHEFTAEERQVEMDTLIRSNTPSLRMGDPLRFQQILHNLVGNAVKFTEAGEVTIRLNDRPGQPLVIEVEDTGIGMSDEQIERLGNAFTQGDNSITRRFGGTGLGMAITFKLVELMGGTIEVFSQVGHGTRVRIELPLAFAPAPSEGDAQG